MYDWDLMDVGLYHPYSYGYTPAGYTAFEKMSLGWATPTELDEHDVLVRDLTTMAHGGKSYIMRNKQHPDEYFMLENRQKEGWDRYIPSSGLLIYHIDYDANVWSSNSINSASAPHYHCTILPADDELTYIGSDGRYSYAQLNGNPFPQPQVTSLNNTSHRLAKLYHNNTNGQPYMNREINGITKNNSLISFDYRSLTNRSHQDVVQPQDKTLLRESFDKTTGVDIVTDLTAWDVINAHYYH